MTALAIEQTLVTLREGLDIIGPALEQLRARGAITDVEAYRDVAKAGQQAHLFDQHVEQVFAPWKSEARALHLAICAEEKAYRDTPLAIERLAGDLCRAWDEQEEARQREEEERQHILAEAHALLEREQQLEELRAAAVATGDASLEEEAAAVEAEPVTVAPSRVPSSRGRAVTRDAPKHKPTFDAEVIDFPALAVAAVGPLVLQQLARKFAEAARDEALTEEARERNARVESELLRTMAEMPRVPLTAIEPSKAWLKVEATRTKDRFNVPGCRLLKDTKSSFARR